MITKTLEETYELFSYLFGGLESEVFDCDPGWSDIIYEMCLAISGYKTIDEKCKIQINKIEQKFGVLNVEYETNSKTITELIKYTERLSYTNCEICGRSGATLYCAEKYLHWSNKKTLCRSHALKLFYYSMPDKKGSK